MSGISHRPLSPRPDEEIVIAGRANTGEWRLETYHRPLIWQNRVKNAVEWASVGQPLAVAGSKEALEVAIAARGVSPRWTKPGVALFPALIEEQLEP